LSFVSRSASHWQFCSIKKIRGEGILRPIYLYRLRCRSSLLATAWKLFLDPGIGLEKAVQIGVGTSFKFDWVVNPR